MADRSQISEGGAHSDPFRIVHWNRSNSRGVGVVHIGVFFIAVLQGGFHKRQVEGKPFFSFEPADRDGAFRAVEIVGDVHVGFHLAEVWEDVDERPFIVTGGRPSIVIFRHTPQQNLAVDRAGAADDFPTGRREHFGLVTRALGHP